MPLRDDATLNLAPATRETLRELIALANEVGFKDPPRALALIEQALTAIKDDERFAAEKIDALIAKGCCLRDLDDYDLAMRTLQAALSLCESLNDAQRAANALQAIGTVHYAQSDYPNALNALQQSLERFETFGDAEGAARALGNIGLTHQAMGDHSNALQFFQRSLAAFNAIGNKKGVASALVNIGSTHYRLADYPRALEHFQQSVSAFEETGDLDGLARALGNIGAIYESLNDYDNALRRYHDSLATFQSLGSKAGAAGALMNIGNALLSLSDLDGAIHHLRQSLALREEIGDKHGAAMSLHNLGGVYFQRGDYLSALRCYEQSLALSQELGDKHLETNALMKIGAAHLQLGALADAEANLQQALALATHIGFKDARFEALRLLSELYAQKKDFEKAYFAHVAFHDAHQDVFNQQTQDKLAQLQVRFETEQTRKHAELLQKEAEIFRLRNIELAQANEKILSSIQYASRIQNALLPDPDKLSRAFADWFALYKPQAIVSGDFYWFYDAGRARFVAVGDCTGHGVPGAFMSLLGISFLNQLVAEQRLRSPAEILTRLNEMVRRALHQEREGDFLTTLQDGMDIGLAKVEGGTLTFAGARRPLYVARARDGEWNVMELKGSRAGIGGYYDGRAIAFREETLELAGDEAAYLTTDGYADMGDAAGKSYGRRRLTELLSKIAPLAMAEQKARLEDEMRRFQGETEQRDDVTIFGFRANLR